MVVKVNVRDNRDAHLPLYPGQRLGRFHVGNGAADDLTAGLFELVDLSHRRGNVPGVRLGHGLDGDRSVSADLNSAYCHGLGHATLFHSANPPSERDYLKKLSPLKMRAMSK